MRSSPPADGSSAAIEGLSLDLQRVAALLTPASASVSHRWRAAGSRISRDRHRQDPLERVLTNDPGIGVARHVDAGYELAAETACEKGISIPMAD